LKDRPANAPDGLGKSVATYEQLKQSVVAGRLKPARRLPPWELSRHLGVSQTPVREALVRLAAEGFVEWRVNQGYYSKAYVASEQTQLLQTCLVLLRSTMAGDWITAPEPLFRSLAALPADAVKRPNGPELIAQRAEDMYVGLARATGNDVLVAYNQTLVERTHRLRLLDVQHPDAGEMTALALSAIGRSLLSDDLEAAQRIGREIVHARLTRIARLVQQANALAEASSMP